MAVGCSSPAANVETLKPAGTTILIGGAPAGAAKARKATSAASRVLIHMRRLPIRVEERIGVCVEPSFTAGAAEVVRLTAPLARDSGVAGDRHPAHGIAHATAQGEPPERERHTEEDDVQHGRVVPPDPACGD